PIAITDLAAQFILRLEDLVEGGPVVRPPGHDPHFRHDDTVPGVVA
ncbi:MAG: hypothetical protein QOJ23_7, partial [Actinomycetota bacterium]|nr:hypothetical protein [Actinomycetota bacterium]